MYLSIQHHSNYYTILTVELFNLVWLKEKEFDFAESLSGEKEATFVFITIYNFYFIKV